MRQHILATALAAAVTALAYGQNLNPTVEVTNAYQGGASALAKPAHEMAVPDSVTRFNLDFDYSVFEKPYQGAYEFTPYYVQLKPTPKPSTTEKFYLRAGAGFTLHPELDFVWSPLQKEKVQLNVYANHRSYFGRYHTFFQDFSTEDEVRPIVRREEKINGFQSDTKAGVDASYGWDGGVATLDVGYLHRMANTPYHFHRTGGLEAKARVRSLPSSEPHFLYDAAIQYHLLGNTVSNDFMFSTAFEDVAFSESRFGLDGTFGPVLDGNRRILVDLDLDLARYRGGYLGYTGLLSATPKYQFEVDRLRLSLGVKVSAIIYSEDFNAWEKDFRHKSGTLFPDVHADFSLLDDRLILQASATGGDKFSTLTGRLASRPFSNEFSQRYGHSLERFRLMAGARGNIAGRFRYDLQGGFARWSHTAVDGFLHNLPVIGERPLMSSYEPVMWERSFNLWFAELDFGWKSEHVTVDGRMAYRHANITGYGAFAPAAFTGYIRPAYNWGERFKAGLDVSWSTSRKAGFTEEDWSRKEEFRLPGWVDLGLFAEYRFTHRFGFWAKGGNLLGQAVQRTPLVAEAGMYFTAGIVLNF